MRVVGLTGGIGSGKSTVAGLFAERGVPVIDTDAIAHELLRQHDVREKVVALCGDAILDPQGNIDRRKLGQQVFSDTKKLARLESLLHPLIRDEVIRRLATLEADYAIVVVPLLVEKGKYDFIDRVLLVDCDETTQLQRTMARDGLSRDAVEAIMARQATRAARRQVADDVIDNAADVGDLEAQVAHLDQQYRQTEPA